MSELFERDIMREIDTMDMDMLDVIELRMNEERMACKDYVSNAIQLGVSQDMAQAIRAAFYSGIEWERTHQWYPCDGEILPPYDMQVLVRLVDEDDGEHWGETFMHRTKNPDVVKDDRDWALLVSGMKHTHWCYVPEFNR